MGFYRLDDFPKETRNRYREMFNRIPLGKRFEITALMMDKAREILAEEIRSAYPEMSGEDVRKEIIKLTLPPDLVKKAYGW